MLQTRGNKKQHEYDSFELGDIDDDKDVQFDVWLRCVFIMIESRYHARIPWITYRWPVVTPFCDLFLNNITYYLLGMILLWRRPADIDIA